MCLCQFLEDMLQRICSGDLFGYSIVFQIGRCVEQVGPPAKTPQFLNLVQPRRPLVMFQMSDTQKTVLRPVFKDKRGNVVKPAGAAVWSTDNTDLLALTPADDLTCEVSSVGPLGTATVTMKIDGDPASGHPAIVGTVQIEVTAGDATTVDLTPDTPSEQS